VSRDQFGGNNAGIVARRRSPRPRPAGDTSPANRRHQDRKHRGVVSSENIPDGYDNSAFGSVTSRVFCVVVSVGSQPVSSGSVNYSGRRKVDLILWEEEYSGVYRLQKGSTVTSLENRSSAASGVPGSTRYVLLTQCLQNDFFFNRECRIYLGDQTAMTMLAGRNVHTPLQGTGGRLSVPTDVVDHGPLGVFLDAAINRRRQRKDGLGTLHVINIRDWHEPGPSYDVERRAYGSHCERGTWGAAYIEGLEWILDPGGKGKDLESLSFAEGSVSICHVHSDSVFDFRPRLGAHGAVDGKLPSTELEYILDILVQGTDDELRKAHRVLSQGLPLSDPQIVNLAQQAGPRQKTDASIYMAIIGAYSDVKILTLVGGLLSRYDLPNLAISDSLTGSPTLERHIAGLDFANKVMHVEVVHGVNDLVRYLGGTPPLNNESTIVDPDGFSRYQTFFKDKQSVLAYQSEKFQDYLALTEKRAFDTYKWIERSNLFLIWWGSAFLIVTLVLTVLSAVYPDKVSWALPAITGGLSLLQLVTAFYTRPIRDLHRNLMNLTAHRMVLESHSLKMALARFHLTTPHTLREVQTAVEAEQAKRQIEVLEKELAAINAFDAVDYDALKNLGFEMKDDTGASENGAAPMDSGGQTPTSGATT
jgi:hypothetical protein